jgi:hypothetical protein
MMSNMYRQYIWVADNNLDNIMINSICIEASLMIMRPIPAVSPATRRQCPTCPASFPNDLALGIHQRTHQPSHSHNDDAATVPPTPASSHGIVLETQQFPASVDEAACPFSSLRPCDFAHQPHTRLQRWVEHVNGHAGPQGVGDDLWFDFVHEALTRRQLLSSVSFCPCGLFVPNTEYGKLRHGRL